MATVTGTGGPFTFSYITPGLKLAPRIRGLSVADHFDTSQNSLITTLDVTWLSSSTQPVEDPKGPETLIFDIAGNSYKIPLSLASLVGSGYNSQVVWRYAIGGFTGMFRYYKEAPKVY